MFWYVDIYASRFSDSVKDMPLEQPDPHARQETRREFLGESAAALIGTPVAIATAEALRKGAVVAQMINVLLEAVGPLPLAAEGVAAAERDVLAVKNLASTRKVIFQSEVIERMEKRVETTRKAFGRASLKQGLNDPPPEEKPADAIEETNPKIDFQDTEKREVLSYIMGSLESVRTRLLSIVLP